MGRGGILVVACLLCACYRSHQSYQDDAGAPYDTDSDGGWAGSSDAGAASTGPGARPSTSASSSATASSSTGGDSSSDPDSETGADSDGSTGGHGEPDGSLGCGSEPGFILEGTLDVDGQLRLFGIELPEDYDPERPYPLVFAWHGRGGDAAASIESQRVPQRWSEPVIALHPEGLADSSGKRGWALAMFSRDFVFFEQLYELAVSELCIDLDRVFTQGHSAGLYMSHRLACWYGELFRAVGGTSGGAPSSAGACFGPIAAYLVHGANDDVVTIGTGRSARDLWLEVNGCGDEAVAIDPSPCVAYDECDSGQPVVWCEHPGDHALASSFLAPMSAFFEGLQ